jgi:hypothetical protein
MVATATTPDGETVSLELSTSLPIEGEVPIEGEAGAAIVEVHIETDGEPSDPGWIAFNSLAGLAALHRLIGALVKKAGASAAGVTVRISAQEPEVEGFIT